MRVELLTIGSELLSGATLNSNAQFLGRRLAEHGLPVSRITTVADRPTQLAQELRELLSRADLVIATGGLGPTGDDTTAAAIGAATGRPLCRHPRVEATIRQFYRARHRQLHRSSLRQALLPRGALPLTNTLGTAPGIWLTIGCRQLVALPGVPREMRSMFERQVMRRLIRLPGLEATHTVTLRTVGIPELQIERYLKRMLVPVAVEIGLYPHLHAVDVQLTGRAATAHQAQQLVQQVERPLARALRAALYARGRDSLEAVVGQLLLGMGQTIGIAESCTGGLLTHRLTNIPGSSRYVRGSVVAYHNDVKHSILGVPRALLVRRGAVSRQAAAAMAAQVRGALASDIGIAITGIAGPGGATPGKPVGLVYFALSTRAGIRTLERRFLGDRTAIKVLAVQTALEWIWRSLIAWRYPSTNGASASTR